MSLTPEDVAGVLAEHEHLYERRAYPSHECTCGWTGSLNDNGGEDDGRFDTADAWRAHLATHLAALLTQAVETAREEGGRAALVAAADEVPWDQYEPAAHDVSGWLRDRAAGLGAGGGVE